MSSLVHIQLLSINNRKIFNDKIYVLILSDIVDPLECYLLKKQMPQSKMSLPLSIDR